jgi:hypothetical protein
MTISIRFPGEDWYGETHHPLELGSGILWIPNDLDIDGYTYFVTQETEDARDLAHEALVKGLLEVMTKPIERIDE